MKRSIWLIFALLSCLTGLALRVYSLGCFEFKMDQARAVLAGPYVLGKLFLISHGMMTTVGVPNPPGFYWILGLFAVFGTSPVYFATVFLLLSCLLPLAVYFILKRHLEIDALLVSVILLAASPILIVLSCNIWAQCLIPLFSLLVIWSLANFIEKKQDIYWFIAVLIAMLAGSIHLSGMFLLPVIVFTVLNKRPGIKIWLASALTGVIIFGGWLIFLLKYWTWKLFPQENSSYLSTLFYSISDILSAPTNFFLSSYFPDDFMRVTEFYAGGEINAWLLLLCGSIPVWMLFIGGLFFYFKNLRINWRNAGKFQIGVPSVVQVAVLVSLSVPLIYLAMGIKVYVFYLLVVAPAFCLVCGYGFSQLKNKTLKYCLLVVFVAAALVNSGLFLRYIDYSGGHPDEYGPSYNFLQKIVNDIDEVRGDKPVNLKIIVRHGASRKFDPLSVQFVFLRFMNSNGVPLYLEIFWNEKDMRFEYILSAEMTESMRRELEVRRSLPAK